jgi:exodeoxyribonuclease VII large subunit
VPFAEICHRLCLGQINFWPESVESTRAAKPTDERMNPVAVLPVSLLVSSARLLIERHLGLAWISGEISNFTRAASGHCYFVLKDSQAQVRCVIFRQRSQLLDVELRDGLSVEVRATPTIYEARGEFQLTVEAVRLAGLGALYEKFAALKAKLDAAGWFHAGRKRSLPAYPRAVGIVTSTRAAALRDVLSTLLRRLPGMPIIVYPTPVQGAAAASSIASAIASANAHARVDVLIVCRGGGSIEDLWAFNEEAVALAIFESRIPIVSGVGHETDFTICDFVADLRAPTPTGAATLVVPDRMALRARALAIAARWHKAVERSLELRMQGLDLISRRLVHPATRIRQQRETVAALASRIARAAAAACERPRSALLPVGRDLARLLRSAPRQRAAIAASHERWRRAGGERIDALGRGLKALEQSLRHLNPQSVLERGYSIVTGPNGVIVQAAAAVDPGDTIGVQFAHGAAQAQVTRRIEP